MRVLIVALNGFTYVWSIVVGLTVLAGIAGIWMKEGFLRVCETFSPFNFINYFLIIALLLPAFGSHYLVDYLRKKQTKGNM